MLSGLLLDGAREMGIGLTPEQVNAFLVYLKELLSFNDKANITAITDEREIVIKHFLDSLLITGSFDFSSQKVVDIGSGGGFPGIPLKIIRPDIDLTLVDSVGKKTSFLSELVSLLALSGTKIAWSRIEDFARSNRSVFDVAVSRAVAPLPVLAEYSLPLLKINGVMIAMKAEDVDDEVNAAGNALKVLGGELAEVKKLALPMTDIVRSFVIVRKASETPKKYPRRAGAAEKRPL